MNIIKKIIKQLTAIIYTRFVQQQQGAVIIFFAMMLPAIVIIAAISINAATSMRERATYSEAANEAVLAISALNKASDTWNNSPEAQQIYREKALNYINYYISGKISTNVDGLQQLTVEYRDKAYFIDYKIAFKNFVFSGLSSNPSDNDMIIANDPESSGNAKKQIIDASIDVVFITDVSGSTTCAFNQPNCNAYQSGKDANARLHYIQKAITGIVKEYMNAPKVNFAIVPYDIGVTSIEPERNKAGGQTIACSVYYKLIPSYQNIDFNVWSDKFINYDYWLQAKQQGRLTDYYDYGYFPTHAERIYYWIDYMNSTYYQQVIAPALGLNSMNDLVNAGLCIKRRNADSPIYGDFKYGCGVNDDDYGLSVKNKQIIANQFGQIVSLYDTMYGDLNTSRFSLGNVETVDVAGTIATLFSGIHNNIISFKRPLAPATPQHSLFPTMCQAPLFSNGFITDRSFMESDGQRYKDVADNIADFSATPHLIELTTNTNEKQQLLDTLNQSTWLPGGGTDTMSALLRSIPVMAKGKAPRKVFILITDGKDDGGAAELRDKFLNQNVCDAIRDGFLSEGNKTAGYIKETAQNVSFYYIKVMPDATGNNFNQNATIYSPWYNSCLQSNPSSVYSVDNYQSLLDRERSIMHIETGFFINKSSHDR